MNIPLFGFDIHEPLCLALTFTNPFGFDTDEPLCLLLTPTNPFGFDTHELPKRVPISVLFWFPIISPLKQPWIFTDANSPSGCRPRPVRLFSIPNCPTWQLGERMETSSCGTWRSAGSASWCFSPVYLICSALLDMRTSRFAPSCGFATTTIRKTAFSTTGCSVRVSRAKSLK